MNAPYDGDRGRAPGDGSPRPEDPYARDASAHAPYHRRDAEPQPSAPEAVGEPPWEGDAGRPAYGERAYGEPGGDADTVQLTGAESRALRGTAAPTAPAPTAPAPQPQQTQQVPQAPQAAQAPETATQAPQAPQPQQPQAPQQPEPAQGDAFAHLFRDQGHPGGGPGGGPAQAGQQAPDPVRPPVRRPDLYRQPPPAAPAAAQPATPPAPPAPGAGAPGQAGPAEPAARPAPADRDPYAEAAAQYAEEPQGPVPTSTGELTATTSTIPLVPTAAEPPADTAGTAEPAERPRSGAAGKAAGLLRSSAIMAAGTLVSRLTGFIRSAMIVAAIGAALLGDTYQTAVTLPTMLYVLTVGGGLNSVFVPQLVRAMKEDGDGGEAYANRLLTLVVCILGPLTVVAVLAAPLLVRVMSVNIASDPAANAVGVAFVRYCLPSIFFMGIHVVMGQILNARGRFGAMMWTPVLNNIVIIASVGCFLWVYGPAGSSKLTVDTVSPEGVRLLGIGTLLGLVVQALAMVPYLRKTGFRIRPRFDWRGHGLGKAARLAKWTILFVLANQAGNLVVIQLSTWAGDTAADQGFPGTGYTAYSQAQLIWNMPQAIITVSVMAALLPRLARAANDGDTGAVRDDISQGLRNSAVAIVPIAFGLLALGIPICTAIYGSSGLESARAMGQALMAFGVGLIPFSVQYVVLRAFYAFEDTRTPFFNTVIIAVVNAAATGLCFVLLPARWAVVGMAASYGLAYVVGVGVAWRRLRVRLGGDLDGARVVRTYTRLAGAAVPATAVAGLVVYVLTKALGSGLLGSLSSVVAGGIVLAAVFVLAAKRMRVEEMTAMVGMVRARLGR